MAQKKILTLKQKHEIIFKTENGSKQTLLAQQYKVAPSTISKILKDKDKILNNFSSRPASTKFEEFVEADKLIETCGIPNLDESSLK